MTDYERDDRAAGLVHRFRLAHDVPRNASHAAVRVNCIAYWEMGDDKRQHFSWVTDLPVSKRNVYRLMRGGRARWKIENETFNTLKNQGYSFEHNYGHGQQNLSVVCATVMMWAFLVEQTQQRCCALLPAVWAKLGSNRLRWERLRAWFYDYALASMRQLLEALFYGLKKPTPIFALDSSSSRYRCPLRPRALAPGDYPIIGGKLRLHGERRLLATRHPVISAPASLSQRRKWMVETLAELSATIDHRGSAGHERELLQAMQLSPHHAGLAGLQI